MIIFSVFVLIELFVYVSLLKTHKDLFKFLELLIKTRKYNRVFSTEWLFKQAHYKTNTARGTYNWGRGSRRTVAVLARYRSSSRGNCLLSFSYIQRASAGGEGNFRMESIRGMYTMVCLLNSLRFPPFHLIKFRETWKLLQTQQERSVWRNAKSHIRPIQYQKPRNFILLLQKTEVTWKSFFFEKFCNTRLFSFIGTCSDIFRHGSCTIHDTVNQAHKEKN